MNTKHQKIVKLPEDIRERIQGLEKLKYAIVFNEDGGLQILEPEGTTAEEKDISVFGSEELRNKTITGMSSVTSVEYTGSPHCEIIEINIHGQTVWIRICY